MDSNVKLAYKLTATESCYQLMHFSSVPCRLTSLVFWGCGSICNCCYRHVNRTEPVTEMDVVGANSVIVRGLLLVLAQILWMCDPSVEDERCLQV